ncbi:hypothetical protein D9619_013070 [Psilocybe cf. subviscida]|uniref:DUF5648 domain-containing protein n=1 Tax=Psilocybe cf. subviscida TaxID=2480587 RepID=A0A8H5EVH9_9AGAR|nr:hypothetical protein D9619_013070 [Psilocybe cf. subviscida]
MIASFKFLMVLPALLGIATRATPVINRGILPAVHSAQEMSPRSASTCADPSLATTIFQAYSGTNTAHIMDVRYRLVNADSIQNAAPALWTFQGAVFKGWRTQQPFTVPLFTLISSDNSDSVFIIGADAQTPPVVSGFTPGAIVAWVYDTAVCDSVPLMSAVLAAKTDHYYTTDPDDHAGLLSAGWTDGGVAAFVLPAM